MKPRDIQRSVRAQRFDRSAGDAPSLGRVSRVPGTGLPKGERRRKRRGESSRGDRERRKRRVVMLTWSVVLTALVCGVLGLVIWLWLRPNMNRGAVDQTGMAEVPVQKRVISQFKSPTEAEALAMVKRGMAMAVVHPTEVAEYFRLGASSAEDVIGFLRGMRETDGRVSGFTWHGSMDANGLLIDGVVVNSQLGQRPRQRLAMLTPDEKGKWRIDFEAFARVVKPSWSELLEKNAASGVVRVVVAKDSYFNGPFRDESQWICFGMGSPDTEVILLGYCRRGSPQAQALERIVSKDKVAGSAARSSKRATLEIQRREGGEARQFEITRVLAEDWVVSGVAFDEKFK